MQSAQWSSRPACSALRRWPTACAPIIAARMNRTSRFLSLFRTRPVDHALDRFGITYIRLAHGFVYLVAIMDWYSRYVLAWRLSNSLETHFCLEALDQALA